LRAPYCNTAINHAIATPAFKARFDVIVTNRQGGSPEVFAETIRKDSAKWADVIKRSGAKLD
jgi:tripartite-type tricarboxylate transporter receptor subunit TctC